MNSRQVALAVVRQAVVGAYDVAAMDDPGARDDRMAVVVDSDVWRIVEPGSVRTLLGDDFEVFDSEHDRPLPPGAVVVTLSLDADHLAMLRKQGAAGLVSVGPLVPIAERARLVALALSAGADFCLIAPTPADFAAHIRALSRRLRLS